MDSMEEEMLSLVFFSPALIFANIPFFVPPLLFWPAIL